MFKKAFLIFFNTIFFFIRHFLLFICVYLITESLFYGVLFNALKSLARAVDFSFSLSFFSKVYIKEVHLIQYIVFAIATSVKLGVYNIAIYDDRNNIGNDFVVYISEFASNIHYILLDNIVFFALLLLTMPTIIGPYIFINLYGYSSIFAIQTDKEGNNYNHVKALNNSRKLTVGRKKSVFFINTIFPALYFAVFLYLTFLPFDIIVNEINFSRFFKFVSIDAIILHFIYMGYTLDNLSEEKAEKDKQAEMADQFTRLRKKDDIAIDPTLNKKIQ